MNSYISMYSIKNAYIYIYIYIFIFIHIHLIIIYIYIYIYNVYVNIFLTCQKMTVDSAATNTSIFLFQ